MVPCLCIPEMCPECLRTIPLSPPENTDSDHDNIPSSPFDANSGFSEEEVAKREAEQLEQLIRGRRGIVMDVIEKEWKEALDSAMETEGLTFCAKAYEGYQTNGRGCIFVSTVLAWRGLTH